MREGPAEEGVKGALVVEKRVGMMPGGEGSSEGEREEKGREGRRSRSARRVLSSRCSMEPGGMI